MLEEKLSQWSAGSEGMMLKYDRDRYLFVFEEKSFSDFAAKRFDVLDAVRDVVAGEGVAATLSIGVGRMPTASRPCSKTPPWRWKWP